MPVLLMARGDEEARSLLKQAIEARYGARPPAIDSLRVTFDGRAHVKVGPIKTWVPLWVMAQFDLPDKMRWDFEVKPMGMTVRQGVESYDGELLRTLRGDDNPEVIESADMIAGARRRLWAIAALLLMPLGDHFVELEYVGERSFRAVNTQIDAAVDVQLREDGWVECISVDAFNDETGNIEKYIIQAESEMVGFGDLLLPKQIQVAWGNQPAYEMQPTNAEHNVELAPSTFTLASSS